MDAPTDENVINLFAGKPTGEAPYGRRKDGTPRKAPGRKKGTAKPVEKVSSETPAPARAPASPKKETAAEATARELETAVATGGGWWSADADAARCERAIHAAKHWVDVAGFAVSQGEAAARLLATRHAISQGHAPREVEAHLARIPWMRDVPIRFGGRDSNCEEVNAQAIAFVAGYFLPATPDHPLAQAGIAIAASFVAYQRAIRESLARAPGASDDER